MIFKYFFVFFVRTVSWFLNTFLFFCEDGELIFKYFLVPPGAVHVLMDHYQLSMQPMQCSQLMWQTNETIIIWRSVPMSLGCTILIHYLMLDSQSRYITHVTLSPVDSQSRFKLRIDTGFFSPGCWTPWWRWWAALNEIIKCKVNNLKLNY